MSFFSELKRRNVFKVGVAYSVACWLLLQIADLVLENIDAPDWVMQVFMLAMALGLPIVLIIAWAFELTPDGIKLEKNVDQDKSIAKYTGRQLNRGIIMILSMVVVLLLTDKFRDGSNWQTEPSPASTAKPPVETVDSDTSTSNRSIAVLPFRDMSASQDQTYFGEGIAEELLNALVKIKDLEVASRTSAFSLADDDLDIPAIAEKLGVAHILEGSIRTSGQKVRVTAQLIEVSKDVHLWSETYDGSLDDIFKIQDEITGKIVAAMEVQLGGATLAPTSELLTDNVEAYQFYLQGRHLWRQRNAAALRESIRLFKAATDLDPGFHQAWSNLAVAYFNLPDYDRSFSLEESFDLGLEAAQKALDIWPESTEALIINANYHEFNCDLTRAASLFEKAIDLNPNEPTAHHWYAILLGSLGRTSLALEHIQEARRIDPLISAVLAIEAELNLSLGNHERAEELHRKAASLGIYNGSLLSVAITRLLAGDLETASEIIEEERHGADPEGAERLGLVLDVLQNRARSEAIEEYIGTADAAYRYDAWDTLTALAILGTPYALEFQSQLACPVINNAFWTEAFRAQRGTAEFFQLMERAGAVDYWREFGWPDDCASLDQTLAECE